MKPGDLIKWVYVSSKKAVPYKLMFSSTMGKWVPIEEPALLISIKDDVYTWLNNVGLFSAHMNDSMTYRSPENFIPQKRE